MKVIFKVSPLYISSLSISTLKSTFDENENEIKRVTPKRGRYALFNGNILHAGSNPIKSNYRIIINYNMVIPND